MMTKTEIADAIDRIKQMAEKLDAAINELAIAVEADEQAEEAPAPKPEKPITLEQIRAAMTALSSAKGAAAAKALLNEFGAVKLSEVPAERYASLLIEAEAWTNE